MSGEETVGVMTKNETEGKEERRIEERINKHGIKRTRP
jgi:hypothetical protein